MRAWLLIICGTLLCLTGCRSLQPDGPVPLNAGGPPLSAQEQAFAEALAHYGQGLLYEAEEGGKSVRALAALQAAAEADPGNHDLLSQIAVVAIRRKEMETAIEALERSYRHDPKSYERCVDLAAGYQAADRREEAVAQYRQSLKLDDTRAAVYVALAGLHFRANEEKQALRTLDRGKRRATNAGLVQLYTYEQAKRFVAHGALKRAIPCFERLADWDEERRHQFYHVLGELHLAVEDDASAIKVLNRATQREDALPESFIDLAAIHIKTDKAKGLEVLQEARKRLPSEPAILFALGCLHSDLEDYGQAIPLFEEARALATAAGEDETKKPSALTEAFYLYHGAAYERTGQLDAAERIFEECISLYPKSHTVLNYLAYMWAESNQKLERALDYVNRALELAPESAAYRDTRGWVFFKQKRYDKALADIEKARELMGADAEILHHLGDIHSALKDDKQALACWSESYALDPGNETVAKKLTQLGINLDSILQNTITEENK